MSSIKISNLRKTYGQFAARCRAVAAGLDELGIGRGERVAVVSENSARMLDKTAKAVEGFARDFEKNRKTTG